METGKQTVAEDRKEEEFRTVDTDVKEHSGPSGERSVNLILDHSAFIRGIGNVKRWFNKEYVAKQLSTQKNNGPTKIKLNIYIPSYTLHEFTFARKGTSILASNAREAIKLVDTVAGAEDDVPSFGEATSENPTDPITYELHIEQRGRNFPSWEQCLQYQQQVPQVKDFPNHRTNLENTVWGRPKKGKGIEEDHGAEEAAEIPRRLTHLIRSCVFKRYIDGSGGSCGDTQWKLVTEEGVTRTWARCFGIDCLNVNEAELLLFHSQDVTGFDVSGPGADFNSDSDKFDRAERGILHQWVDTTKYSYEKLGKDRKKKGRKNTLRKQKLAEEATLAPPTPGVLKEEDFDLINFAPRAKGSLYVPKKAK